MDHSLIIAKLCVVQFPALDAHVYKPWRAYARENGCLVADDAAIDYIFGEFPAHFEAHLDLNLDGSDGTESGLTSAGREKFKDLLKRYREYHNFLMGREGHALLGLWDDHEENEVLKERYEKFNEGLDFDDWAFFHRPRASVDYDYWGNIPVFTVEEIVALSLRKEPTVVNEQSLGTQSIPDHSPFYTEYRRRLAWVSAAVTSGELKAPVTRKSLEQWSTSEGFPIPDIFFRPIKELTLNPPLWTRHSFQEINWEEKYHEVTSELEKLKEQVRLDHEPMKGVKGGLTLKTAYKLILGMAIARFEHTTGVDSSASKKIENALKQLVSDATDLNLDLANDSKFDQKSYRLQDLTLSDDSIRKALKEAAQFLDAQWPTALKRS